MVFLGEGVSHTALAWQVVSKITTIENAWAVPRNSTFVATTDSRESTTSTLPSALDLQSKAELENLDFSQVAQPHVDALSTISQTEELQNQTFEQTVVEESAQSQLTYPAQ